MDSVKPNLNVACRRRIAPPDDLIAGLGKSELRQRRRVGADSRRQQRRVIARYRAVMRLDLSTLAESSGRAAAAMRKMAMMMRKMGR